MSWRRSKTAAEEAVVELDDANVRFAHPLLGSICYERAPLWKRRAVHRALAGAVSDVEERARHLALAADGPDPVAASYLEAASEQAAARGAPGAAAELSELAAALTADDPALERARRFRAARFHRMAGDGEQAVAILEQLLSRMPLRGSSARMSSTSSPSPRSAAAAPRSSAATRRWSRRRTTTRGLRGSWHFVPERTCSRPTSTRRWPTAGRQSTGRSVPATRRCSRKRSRTRGRRRPIVARRAPGCSSAASRSSRSSAWSSSGTGARASPRAPADAPRRDCPRPRDLRPTSRRKRRPEGKRSRA